MDLNEFIIAVNTNQDSENIDKFMKLMEEANLYQQYLNEENFKLLQSYINYVESMTALPSLNPLQQRVTEKYSKDLKSQKPLYFGKKDEGGATLKYEPNGFISSLIIMFGTLIGGVLIAAVFLSNM